MSDISTNLMSDMPENAIVLCDKELSEILDLWMKLCSKYHSRYNMKTIVIEMNILLYNGIRGGNYASMIYNLENPK